MRQAGVDERATKRKVHIHQDAVSVDPAGVRRRLLSLPREICVVVPNSGLRKLRGNPTAAQKSAAGKVGNGNEPTPFGEKVGGLTLPKAQTVPSRTPVLGK